jgi:hypothetical protein
MLEKTPFLKKKHILFIILMILVSGMISISPALLGYFLPDTGVATYSTNVGSGDTGLVVPVSTDSASNIGFSTQTVTESSSTHGETQTATPQPSLEAVVEKTQYTYIFTIIKRGYGFYVQTGSPAYIANFAHPVEGCKWASVAGQVFGDNDNPISGYTAVITGTIAGKPISLSGLTGAAQSYGSGGYEIKLAGEPFASTGALKLSLYDRNKQMIAAPVMLTTIKDCQKNVILINFVNG